MRTLLNFAPLLGCGVMALVCARMGRRASPSVAPDSSGGEEVQNRPTQPEFTPDAGVGTDS